VKFLSNDHNDPNTNPKTNSNDPNTNPKTLMMLNLSITDPHDAFESICVPGIL